MSNTSVTTHDNHLVFYLKDLRKTFPNGKFLHFQGEMKIKRNCLTFITGHSGIGKSTLIHIFGLLDRADIDKDTILRYQPFPDQPPKDYFELYRKDSGLFSNVKCAHLRQHDFGFLPQSGHLLDAFSIFENLEIAYTLRMNQEKTDKPTIKKELTNVLKDVGLWELYEQNSISGESGKLIESIWDLSPAVLSGGQAQRLSLARAILCYPGVIFVDEPTTFMDQELVTVVMESLARLVKDKGCSILVVSHQPEALQRVAKKHGKNIKIDTIRLKKNEVEGGTMITW